MNPGLRLKGLVSSAPNLMDLVPGVSGAAVSYQGRITSVGQTPGQVTLLCGKGFLHVLFTLFAVFHPNDCECRTSKVVEFF